MLVLLPLLGGGAAGADERHDDDHDRGDGAHGDHDDDQEVAVLLGRGAAVRWTHLTNWGLWKKRRELLIIRQKVDLVGSVADNCDNWGLCLT